jgi:FkbM family methyltransferase
VSSDLIYDVGLHKGEDSEFYLAKGFRVIGVEANPEMCRAAEARLSEFVESGRLKIVNVAVAKRAGSAPFFRNNKESEWGTVIKGWSDHNRARGCPSDKISVKAATLAQIVREHGPAHYLKIDIEGMDVGALRSLGTIETRPQYISIESAFPREASFANARTEFSALSALGYQWFKIIPQHEVESQVPPHPALEGRYVPFRFSGGSSGLFVEEAPGKWLSLDEALKAFRCIIRGNSPQAQLYQYYRVFLTYARVMRRFGKQVDLGWYDIHARHACANP